MGETMPVYLFWGEDDWAIAKAVKKLVATIIDPEWKDFNYHKAETVIEALDQVMTPAFGLGERLVWLDKTSICQNCPENILGELTKTLPVIPATNHLLLTSDSKPDRRLKSTKLLEKYAEIKEFSLIPPWNTEELQQKIRELAQEVGVKLTHDAIELLADSVGNNTRQIWQELEKLSLIALSYPQPLETEIVASLVNVSNRNSLQLATAIRLGKIEKAIGIVSELINQNEPALKIVATLVGQFRTWTIVKLMLEQGEREEKTIASIAEISNPKRIYFLRQEVNSLSSKQLLASLSLLAELEYNLKRGSEPLATLEVAIIQLCAQFQ
jgi:DNA polymerase-3 subunit delta